VITYLLSQCRYRPRRLFSVVAGVALGAALSLLIAALGNGFRLAAKVPLDGVGADLVVSRAAAGIGTAAASQRMRGARVPFGLGTFSADEAAAMGREPGVSSWAAGLQLWDFGPNQYVTVLGLDPADTAGPARVLAESMLAGRALLPGESGSVVVDQHYALFFQVRPGAEVMIGGKPFRVVGIASQHSTQVAPANLYIPLPDARALAALPADAVNQIYLKTAQASQVEEIATRLTAGKGDLQVTTEGSVLKLMGGIGQITARFARVAAGVALGGGLVLAWLVVTGLVAERRQEIGLMLALGWRRRDIFQTFLVEGVMLGAVGALAGVVLGLGVARSLSRLPMPSSASSVHQVLSSLHGAPGALQAVATPAADLSFPAQATAAEVLLVLAAVTIVAAMAAWVGVRRSLRVRPAHALRPS
jgi:ABC-type antimicrobial peptide transport system permease subunit